MLNDLSVVKVVVDLLEFDIGVISVVGDFVAGVLASNSQMNPSLVLDSPQGHSLL